MFTIILGKNIHYQLINKQWIEEGRAILVFLHEGLGSIGQWKDFPTELSQKLQLPALVYDRVGYGQSDYWEGPISAKFLHFEGLAMLPKLIEKLGFTNSIIIFGHSDGGTIGLIQASQPMVNLIGAIIEAPHVMLEEHSLVGIRRAKEMADRILIRAMNRYHSGRAQQLIEAWTSHWLNANEKDWDAIEQLKKITTPLLLIQGEHDDFGTFAQLDKIAEHVQSKIISIEKIENCGHIPHLQQTGTIIKLSEDFIKKLKI